MYDILNALSLPQLSWLILVVYILHYVEEGPRLVKWFHRNGGKSRNGIKYTQNKLNTENLILFIYSLIIILLFNIYPENITLAALVLGAPIGFLINTFFHCIPTIKEGRYSPGDITASMLNPALFIWIFRKAFDENYLSFKVLFIALLFGLIALPISIYISHKVIWKNENIKERE